jgi:hypothetical protein
MFDFKKLYSDIHSQVGLQKDAMGFPSTVLMGPPSVVTVARKRPSLSPSDKSPSSMVVQAGISRNMTTPTNTRYSGPRIIPETSSANPPLRKKPIFPNASSRATVTTVPSTPTPRNTPMENHKAIFTFITPNSTPLVHDKAVSFIPTMTTSPPESFPEKGGRRSSVGEVALNWDMHYSQTESPQLGSCAFMSTDLVQSGGYYYDSSQIPPVDVVPSTSLSPHTIPPAASDRVPPPGGYEYTTSTVSQTHSLVENSLYTQGHEYNVAESPDDVYGAVGSFVGGEMDSKGDELDEYRLFLYELGREIIVSRDFREGVGAGETVHEEVKEDIMCHLYRVSQRHFK